MRPFNLHPTSLLAGLAIGLFVFALLGADPTPTTPAPREPAGAGIADADERDRYELSAWANQDGHGAFVLNTHTGEVVSIIGRTISAADTANVEATQKRAGLYSVQPVQR